MADIRFFSVLNVIPCSVVMNILCTGCPDMIVMWINLPSRALVAE